MANINSVMSGISNTLALPLDNSKSYIAGVYNNFTIIISKRSVNGYYTNIDFRITAFNPATNNTLSANDLSVFINTINQNTRKHFVNASIKNCLLEFSFRNVGKKEDLILNICNSIAYVTQQLASNNYVSCDEFYGRTENVLPVAISGNYHIVDSISYNEITNQLSQASAIETNTKENYPAGIVGAILGSLIGVVVIVIIGQLNYVAVISGLVMGFCTFNFYQKFAKKITWIGIIICSVIMIAMIYFAVQVDCALWITRTYSDYTFFDAFTAISAARQESAEFAASYSHGLFMQYLYSGIGAIITAVSLIGAQKNKYTSNIL